MVTVEAALALVTLVTAVALCVGALLAVLAQIRCVDAAHQAVLLAARGEGDRAVTVARRLAPPAAEVAVHRDGGLLVASVSVAVRWLPAVRLHAEAFAVPEPGRGP